MHLNIFENQILMLVKKHCIQVLNIEIRVQWEISLHIYLCSCFFKIDCNRF